MGLREELVISQWYILRFVVRILTEVSFSFSGADAEWLYLCRPSHVIPPVMGII